MLNTGKLLTPRLMTSLKPIYDARAYAEMMRSLQLVNTYGGQVTASPELTTALNNLLGGYDEVKIMTTINPTVIEGKPHAHLASLRRTPQCPYTVRLATQDVEEGLAGNGVDISRHTVSDLNLRTGVETLQQDLFKVSGQPQKLWSKVQRFPFLVTMQHLLEGFMGHSLALNQIETAPHVFAPLDRNIGRVTLIKDGNKEPYWAHNPRLPEPFTQAVVAFEDLYKPVLHRL
jgi:hypothetical protein